MAFILTLNSIVVTANITSVVSGRLDARAEFLNDISIIFFNLCYL